MDSRWWQGGGYRVAAPDAPTGTFFSRPFLEAGVRARVRALPNVEFVTAAARGLASDEQQVRGVKIGDDGGERTLTADLVVDASGRGSQASTWLEAMGYDAPPVAHVTIDMGYATRLYRRTPGRLPDGTWIVTIADVPNSKRFGVCFPIEGDRWIVTLAGCHGDHPPTDEPATSTTPTPSTPATSPTSSGTRSPSCRSSATACRRTSGATSRSCPATRPASWPSATRSAASTRSTARG
jgi:hypothetical protein